MILSASKATALFALGCCFAFGCGKSEAEKSPTPTAAPQAASGKGVVSGMINIASSGCSVVNGFILIVVLKDTTTTAFQQVYPPPTPHFEAQLAPGSYTITVQAPPCVSSRSFDIGIGESIVQDMVL